MAAIPKYFFSTDSSIGQLCEDLNENVGQGIYYDTFEIQNTKWFRLVGKTFTVLNNKKIRWMFWNVPEFCSKDSK